MLALACSCGRIGFDLSEADGIDIDASPVASMNGTCATAAEIAIGTMLANQSVDASNDVTPWGLCPDGPDVVYRVTVAETTMVSIVARASFTIQVTTSTSCPPTLTGSASCYTTLANQDFQQSYTLSPGTTYIIVDKLSGSGTSFDIAVQ